jgi:hypothetical protein
MDAIQFTCLFVGATAVYLYRRHLASEPLIATNSSDAWNDAKWLLLGAAAWVLLIILPWSLFLHYSPYDVLTGNVPRNSIRKAIYVVYVVGLLGILLLLQALALSFVGRDRG